MTNYIHDYQRHYDNWIIHLKQDRLISEHNKRLIFEFERACYLNQKLELPTRIKYFDVLGNLAKNYTKKDFDKLTRKDFENIIMSLESKKDWSTATKQSTRF